MFVPARSVGAHSPRFTLRLFLGPFKGYNSSPSSPGGQSVATHSHFFLGLCGFARWVFSSWTWFCTRQSPCPAFPQRSPCPQGHVNLNVLRASSDFSVHCPPRLCVPAFSLLLGQPLFFLEGTTTHSKGCFKDFRQHSLVGGSLLSQPHCPLSG